MGRQEEEKNKQNAEERGGSGEEAKRELGRGKQRGERTKKGDWVTGKLHHPNKERERREGVQRQKGEGTNA